LGSNVKKRLSKWVGTIFANSQMGGAAAATYDNPFLRIKHEFVESRFMYMSDRSKGCMHA
jgi:hypothetical protein